jgi:hypothetical protein
MELLAPHQCRIGGIGTQIVVLVRVGRQILRRLASAPASDGY